MSFCSGRGGWGSSARAGPGVGWKGSSGAIQIFEFSDGARAGPDFEKGRNDAHSDRHNSARNILTGSTEGALES